MAPRKWSDIRPQIVVRPPSVEEPIETVVARLAGQPDGRRLMEWMLEEVLVGSHPNASDAWLREAEGARRLVMRIREMAAVKS